METPLLRAMGLVSALCDERLVPDEARELESLVLGDIEIRRAYIRVMYLHSGLYHYASALGSLPEFSSTPMSESEAAASGEIDDDSGDGDDGNRMEESMVLPALRDTGPDADEEVALPSPPLFSPVLEPPKRGFSPALKGGIAAALLLSAGIAAALMLRGGRSTPNVAPSPERVVIVPAAPVGPPPIPIATVTCVANPVWQGGEMPLPSGDLIAGQTLGLASGDVQMSFHRGGRLVVEGPVEVAFISDTRIKLLHGRIAATIPGGGLVVDCPCGSVKDLGTQFGIDVGADGATEVQVFQGRVAATLGSAAASSATRSSATTQPATALQLTVGQAAMMTHGAVALDPNGAVPQQFVRSLVNNDVKTLDVTDLISGGDGTSRLRGIGINSNTGGVGKLSPVPERYSNGKYHHIKAYPVLDGSFIPDGRKGAMVIDSVGDTFNFAHADGTSYDYIFTGGKIPWRFNAGLPTVMDGIDYSSPDHSIVFMHANNAITLDLNAIRRLYPDRALTTFRCRVGNSAVPNTTPHNAKPFIPDANVEVVVDGVLRFEKLRISYPMGSLPLEIPIKQEDRFLTLATTNNGNGIGEDWILWVDAKLDVSALK